MIKLMEYTYIYIYIYERERERDAVLMTKTYFFVYTNSGVDDFYSLDDILPFFNKNLLYIVFFVLHFMLHQLQVIT